MRFHCALSLRFQHKIYNISHKSQCLSPNQLYQIYIRLYLFKNTFFILIPNRGIKLKNSSILSFLIFFLTYPMSSRFGIGLDGLIRFYFLRDCDWASIHPSLCQQAFYCWLLWQRELRKNIWNTRNYHFLKASFWIIIGEIYTPSMEDILSHPE